MTDVPKRGLNASHIGRDRVKPITSHTNQVASKREKTMVWLLLIRIRPEELIRTLGHCTTVVVRRNPTNERVRNCLHRQMPEHDPPQIYWRTVCNAENLMLIYCYLEKMICCLIKLCADISSLGSISLIYHYYCPPPVQ